MSEIGIGIIGYGEFAQFSHEAWKGLDGCEVLAASDVVRERVPDELTYYEDWREMLRDERIGIITIGTPPSTHGEMAIAALRAGKHVFVEKPPELTYAEAVQIADEANRANRQVVVDYMIRYNPIAEALRAIDRENLLGKLQHVSISNYAYDGKLGPDHWFWDKSLSGGILVEHAVHFFDLITYIHDSKPERLTAHAVSRKPGIEDKVEASVVYNDGLLATHYHHFFRPWWFERQTFRFAFDLGEIDVEGWIPLGADVRALVTPETKARLAELFPDAEMDCEPLDVSEVTAGGTDYTVSEMADFFFMIQEPKMYVYSDLVKQSMGALVAAAQGSMDLPRNGLSEVLDSIRIADAATRFAEKQGSVVVEV